MFVPFPATRKSSQTFRSHTTAVLHPPNTPKKRSPTEIRRASVSRQPPFNRMSPCGLVEDVIETNQTLCPFVLEHTSSEVASRRRSDPCRLHLEDTGLLHINVSSPGFPASGSMVWSPTGHNQHETALEGEIWRNTARTTGFKAPSVRRATRPALVTSFCHPHHCAPTPARRLDASGRSSSPFSGGYGNRRMLHHEDIPDPAEHCFLPHGPGPGGKRRN